MKSFVALLLVVVSSGFIFFTTDTDFEGLKALNGVWRMQTSRGLLFEEWVMPESSSMKGKSYRLKGSDTVILENTSIVKKTEGVFYVAIVQNQNNQQPVPFKLVSSDNSRFVFENKEHDYPQRVIYKIINSDSVVARIEGSKDGKEKFSDFYYARVK